MQRRSINTPGVCPFDFAPSQDAQLRPGRAAYDIKSPALDRRETCCGECQRCAGRHGLRD
jgi:hypothetical protein